MAKILSSLEGPRNQPFGSVWERPKALDAAVRYGTMCNQSCLSFGHQNLGEAEIRGQSILEVGSRKVNGSLRSHLQSLAPASYLGVDIFPGEGVDEICNAERLDRKSVV